MVSRRPVPWRRGSQRWVCRVGRGALIGGGSPYGRASGAIGPGWSGGLVEQARQRWGAGMAPAIPAYPHYGIRRQALGGEFRQGICSKKERQQR